MPSTHGTRWADDPVPDTHVMMLVSRLAACCCLHLSEPDRLELLYELGCGSFGVAYLCRSREEAEVYVLKKISLKQLNAPGNEQFVSEVRPRVE